MTDAASPMYAPFFGVMGATSAIVFSGKCDWTEKDKKCV